MSTTWASALNGFEARLEAIEHALVHGAWEQVPGWSPPHGELDAPTVDEVERLRELLERAERCRSRMATMLRTEASRILEQRRRREAAAGYRAAPGLNDA